MPAEGPEQLLREYRDYDRRCDVVSCFEVNFTEARQMVETVRHFERFPRFTGTDGAQVTPDFTVLFRDGTMLVGEISKLARNEESVQSLLRQLRRYENLTQGPCGPAGGGGHELATVSEVDILLLVPAGEANVACDRIDAELTTKEAVTEGESATGDAHSVEPESAESLSHPSVLGYSYDDEGSRFVFTFSDRANNPRPRSHKRNPSLESWLLGNSDTLRCRSDRFSRITAIKRFMNDRPPAVYTATMLWLDGFPAAAGGVSTVDLAVDPAVTATWLRENYGWGDANAVRRALEFLAQAGLARQRRDDWLVGLRPIASSNEEVRRELVDRFLARPRRPISMTDRQEHAAQKARDRETVESNTGRQAELDFDAGSDDPEPAAP